MLAAGALLHRKSLVCPSFCTSVLTSVSILLLDFKHAAASRHAAHALDSIHLFQSHLKIRAAQVGHATIRSGASNIARARIPAAQVGHATIRSGAFNFANSIISGIDPVFVGLDHRVQIPGFDPIQVFPGTSVDFSSTELSLLLNQIQLNLIKFIIILIVTKI
jgi:hypothetical protein